MSEIGKRYAKIIITANRLNHAMVVKLRYYQSTTRIGAYTHFPRNDHVSHWRIATFLINACTLA